MNTKNLVFTGMGDPLEPDGRTVPDADLQRSQSTSRVLLLEPDEELVRTRVLLLKSLGGPVYVVRNLADLWNSPCETRYCLIVVSLTPRLAGLPSALTWIRRRWPEARILLLGECADGIEDQVYDDIVNARHHPADLVNTARRLVAANSSMTRG